MHDKRILVTGGHGFLGSHIVDQLTELGYKDVHAPGHMDYDLLRADRTEQMYIDKRPDIVIHCAATVGGIGANRARPGEMFYDNMQMGLNVIEGARLYNVEKLVMIGTTCSYPKFCPIPFDETTLWDGYPEETNAPYGIAKKALLTMCQAYRQQWELNAIYLIPANLYGPRDDFSLDDSHVIPAIIRKCTKAVEAGRDVVELWGTGKPTREFLYVEDAASAIIRAMERYNAMAPLNIGHGQEISIARVAHMIADLTSFRGRFHWDATQPDGQPRRALDPLRTHHAIGSGPATLLEVGLRKTIDWYRS